MEDGLGRMECLRLGELILVKSPVSLGRVKQLVCNGFSFTGLIFEEKILQQVLSTIKNLDAHYVFETDQPLLKRHLLILKVMV